MTDKRENIVEDFEIILKGKVNGRPITGLDVPPALMQNFLLHAGWMMEDLGVPKDDIQIAAENRFSGEDKCLKLMQRK
jgi:hypothetical protein